jgi:hypothetical protein
LQNGACSREKELQKGANRNMPVKLTIIKLFLSNWGDSLACFLLAGKIIDLK